MPQRSQVPGAVAWILIAGCALAGTACVATASGRLYDPVYGDYHYWNSDEESTYQVYLGERNLPHRAFRSLSKVSAARPQYRCWSGKPVGAMKLRRAH